MSYYVSPISEVLPALAAVCGEEGLIFQGITEGIGVLPAAANFTDLKESSPAYGASFCVPLPFMAEDVRAAVLAKRENFSMAGSWGGPVGYDSGADYARI